jgi:tetratricopeptide (TPR) repeat protein
VSGAAQALYAEAVAHYHAQRLDEAERALAEVLAIEPRHADSLHVLGVIAAQQRRFETAADLFRKAAALQPSAEGPRYNLGNALKDLGRLEEAITAYRNAIVLKPNHAEAYNNLGFALETLGRHDEALACYRRAFALKPTFAEARFNEGNVLKTTGRLAEALDAYAGTLAIRPDYVTAHNNQGVALKMMGRLEEAAAALHRALALRPDYADACNNLGATLQSLGRLNEALAACDRAIALNPASADAHNNRGGTLKDLGRYEEATEAYAQALAMNPQCLNPQINLAITLEELGRFAEAGAAVERALEIDPNSGEAWQVRADLKTFTADDADVARMEALLAPGAAQPLDAGNRTRLHFVLGKAWLDIGDADKAFSHFAEGSRLKRATLAYDGDAAAHWMARIARTDPPTARGEPSSRPIFVLGMPRSGSSLIEQILASHPQVHGAGELNLVEQVIREAGAGEATFHYPEDAPALSAADLRAMGSAYLQKLSALAPSGERVVDKLPGNFQFAGLIHAMLPNARIIHCRRNPIDTCLSCYTKLFATGQDFAYDMTELGQFYRAYDGLMTHWRATLPADRFLEVGYEDLVEDLEGISRRLVAFCGLAWDAACLDFHRTERAVRTASASQVRRPLFRTSLERWKRHERHLTPLLDALGPLAPAEYRARQSEARKTTR